MPATGQDEKITLLQCFIALDHAGRAHGAPQTPYIVGWYRGCSSPILSPLLIPFYGVSLTVCLYLFAFFENVFAGAYGNDGSCSQHVARMSIPVY